jgi:hypothetical protein
MWRQFVVNALLHARSRPYHDDDDARRSVDR